MKLNQKLRRINGISFEGDTVLFRRLVRSDPVERASLLNISYEYVATEPVTSVEYEANVRQMELHSGKPNGI